MAALNAFGNGPTAGVAATPYAPIEFTVEWPCVCPAVTSWNRPRFAFRCRKRGAAAAFFTITMRGLAAFWFTCSIGSCVPFWMFVDMPTTAVPVEFSRNRS